MVTLSLLDPQAATILQKWNFQHESLIRIGRAPDNDIILNDALVSRHHVELSPVKDSQVHASWHLVNKGTNGTFVNNILVSQGLISHNSLIQLARGGPLLKFEIQQLPAKPLNIPAQPQVCNHAGNPANNLFCIHCGQPVVEVQQFIRQYQVLRPLGQGGMGTTYLAWDKDGTINGRPQLLVLKEMNADMAQVEKARELFEREARILKSLNHPAIPKYYDFFVEAGKKYLAMELIHGENLEKIIYQRGPVAPIQAIAWMIQTCDVLGYIHSQTPPLIHRDIKPANLMVRHIDNQVVVLDFGAVKESSLLPGTRIGAPDYAAPEQNQGKPVPQSDLYAIGPTLIFLLTGQSPFNFYRQGGKGYFFDLAGIPTVTPQLQSVIEKVTEHNQRDRYQTADQLAQALANCF